MHEKVNVNQQFPVLSAESGGVVETFHTRPGSGDWSGLA